MSQIIVFGSINLDLVFYSSRAPFEGETLEGKAFEIFLGGKGANQAVASSRLGNEVSFVGTVGKDEFGLQLKKELSKEKINLTLVESLDATTGTAVINVFDDAENQIIYVPGANNYSQHTSVTDANLIDSNLVICQMEVNTNQVESLFLRSKEKGNLNILNLAPYKKPTANLLSFTDYLIVNENEFCELVGTPFEDALTLDFIKREIKDLNLSKKTSLIVTLGSRGVFFYQNENSGHIEGIKKKAIDTVGSGDCFVGAFAHSINQEESILDSCEFANKCAALSVTKKGASTSMPTLSEVEQVYKL